MAPTVPITYIPDAVPEHQQLFSTLLAGLPWQRKTTKQYGKVCPVPRDEVWVADYPYTYSRRTYEPNSWTTELIELKGLAENYAGVKYDSVFINLYRSGKDSVSWHCDCEAEMSSNHPICSISLGATRKFQVRARQPKNSPIESYLLESGSIVLMQAGMQHEWLHQVPAQPRITEPRINLTFRVMTEI